MKCELFFYILSDKGDLHTTTTVEFSKRYNNLVMRYWPKKFLCARPLFLNL